MSSFAISGQTVSIAETRRSTSFTAATSDGFAPDRIVKRLDYQLHFTDQQRAQVTSIIQARQQRIGVIQNAVRPQIRAQIDQTNAEIEKILTPEQRTKFQEIKMRIHRPHNNN